MARWIVEVIVEADTQFEAADMVETACEITLDQPSEFIGIGCTFPEGMAG